MAAGRVATRGRQAEGQRRRRLRVRVAQKARQDLARRRLRGHGRGHVHRAAGRRAGNGGAVSEYEIPAEVLEQAAAAARNNATKDLSFDLGGWDTAPEVVREQWRTVVRIAAPLIAADAYRAGQ